MSLNVETHSIHSPTSSVTEGENVDIPEGQGKSALPEEVIQDVTQDLEDDWDNDPANARNWTWGQKWTAAGVLSLYTFVSPLASSTMAPGLPEIGDKYNIQSPTVVALTLSIFLLAFAIAPLILAPLSEMYGRTWVLHIGNLVTLGLNLGCAFAPSTASLIALRFLSGLSASAPIAVGGGMVADLFSENDRASAMAVYTLGPLIGSPVVGPIAGGFIAQTVGVKWVFIVIAITCGVSALISIPILRETYAPVIRRRQAAKYGDSEKAASLQPAALNEHGKLYYLWLNLSRPVVLLFGSFVCFIFSLYMAFMYGIYYLMFTTFPKFFSTTYNFSPGIGGLCYIGLGIGFFLATLFGAKFADQIYKYLARKNDGVAKPEMRIPALFLGSFFVPIGLFWYGWSAAAKLHWIMPIIGTAIFGFGMMSTYLPIQLYLVDSFTYGASATSGAALFRSLFGFVFPLFGQQMFNRLGLGGGNSLLAGLAILLGIPFPVWIYYRGEQLRASNRYTKHSVVPKKPT
ncbi:multidrug resistance protein 4 [Phlegmacium glaucopus]|nr:multidrug resistance protein 4 [Phlegmacium glaucopus]